MNFEEFIIIIVLGLVVIFGVFVMTHQTYEDRCEAQKYVRHSQEWTMCLKALSEQK